MEIKTGMEVFEQGLTKSDIKGMVTSAINHVLENGNPLRVAEAISAMETFIKEFRAIEKFSSYVRDETIKHGKVYTSPSGAKIELAETGTSYDFTQCNDGLLASLEQKFMSAKNAVEERKDFLKNVPANGLLVTDEETGETYNVYKPSKQSKSSYKITLSK